LPNIITVLKTRIRWVGHLENTAGTRNAAHKILVGKPEGKRPFGRPRHRWKDIIKLDLLPQDRGKWGVL
jgi:hypothetical protein